LRGALFQQAAAELAQVGDLGVAEEKGLPALQVSAFVAVQGGGESVA
jgi:hypothetical protein